MDVDIAPEVGVDAAVERLAEELDSRGDALVIVDGVDRVPGGGAVAERLLERTSSTRWLLLSRAPLAGCDAGVVELPCLDVDAAVSLLEAQIATERRGFALDGPAREAALAVVNLVGPAPLAIEIVAAQAAARGVEALRDDLGAALTDKRSASDWPVGLVALLEWRWQRLSVPLRAALCDWAMIPGWFDQQTVDAVVRPQHRTRTIDLLDALTAAALMRARRGAHGVEFRVQDAVAEFVRQRADDSSQKAAAQRLQGVWARDGAASPRRSEPAPPAGAAAGGRAGTLEVDALWCWFIAPGGERVDISRRRAVRRVFAALVRHRLDEPGASLTVDDLVAAGWPDETLLAESAANRVYVAIATLRSLGLRGILVNDGEGYLLRSNVLVHQR